jgi:hypothetical protein
MNEHIERLRLQCHHFTIAAQLAAGNINLTGAENERLGSCMSRSVVFHGREL